jgi:hypothetical protein
MIGSGMKYRVTIRFGTHRMRYHTLDLDATDLAKALIEAVNEIPSDVLETADLLEARLLGEPEEREYVGDA